MECSLSETLYVFTVKGAITWDINIFGLYLFWVPYKLLSEVCVCPTIFFIPGGVQSLNSDNVNVKIKGFTLHFFKSQGVRPPVPPPSVSAHATIITTYTRHT